jgi:hypothetical protein
MKTALIASFALLLSCLTGHAQALTQCNDAGHAWTTDEKSPEIASPVGVPSCQVPVTLSSHPDPALSVGPNHGEAFSPTDSGSGQFAEPGDSALTSFAAANGPDSRVPLSAEPSAAEKPVQPEAAPARGHSRAALLLLAVGLFGSLVFRTFGKSGGTAVIVRPSWLSRRCRYCYSSNVRPSRKRGPFESLLLPLMLLAPFRCASCFRRCYGFVFIR